MELRTVEGEWPEWAKVPWDEGSSCEFQMPPGAPMASFDAVRFIEADGSLALMKEFAPICLQRHPPHRVYPPRPWGRCIPRPLLRFVPRRLRCYPPRWSGGGGDTLAFKGIGTWTMS